MHGDLNVAKQDRPTIASLRSVVLDEDIVEPLHLARLPQLEARVLTHRLVQAVARDPKRVLAHDQRLVDQGGQQVQRRSTGPRSIARTGSTSSTVNRPAKMHRRRRSLCSAGVNRSWLQSMVVRSVCCRGSAARPPPVRSANRSVRRSRICSTVSTRILTAASSMASGGHRVVDTGRRRPIGSTQSGRTTQMSTRLAL